MTVHFYEEILIIIQAPLFLFLGFNNPNFVLEFSSLGIIFLISSSLILIQQRSFYQIEHHLFLCQLANCCRQKHYYPLKLTSVAIQESTWIR